MAAVTRDISRSRRSYSYFRPRPIFRTVATEDEMSSVTATINLVNNLKSVVEGFSTQTVDNIVWNEILTGVADGSNNVFYFANKPQIGKIMLFINGILQENKENADYQINDKMLILNYVPPAESKVMATYAK